LFVALLVATYTLAVHGGVRARGLGLAVLLIVVPWSMSRDPSNTTVLSVLPGVFLEAGAWAAGAAVRSRHERAAQAQAQAVEATRGAALAAADERMRIARELHDTVAHGLSVVVVQASMATLAWERGDPQVGTALAAVERSGRDALAQLRQLVDVLRPGVDHGQIELSRGLHQLPALLDGIRDTGVRVEYEDVSGLACADLPALVEHAIYRIVQEALTNVVKHVGPTTARVRLERVTCGVRVRVEDDGPQPGPAMRIDSGGSSGVGHIGLRERVTALGGSLQVGRERAGGYAVTATVPVEIPAR